MNFLAHIYLSDDHEKLMIGNFIGDFVKGNQLESFEEDIKKGVQLHRAIDEYTDSHKIVSQSKDKLREKYRHYSGVIVDVYYDHFLAKYWTEYHHEAIIPFTEKFYETVFIYSDILPPRASNMLIYMQRDNWLYNYSKIEGIHKALTGMSHRTKFDSKMDEASVDLKLHYQEFEKEFRSFFKELRSFAKHWIATENI